MYIHNFYFISFIYFTQILKTKNNNKIITIFNYSIHKQIKLNKIKEIIIGLKMLTIYNNENVISFLHQCHLIIVHY